MFRPLCYRLFVSMSAFLFRSRTMFLSFDTGYTDVRLCHWLLLHIYIRFRTGFEIDCKCLYMCLYSSVWNLLCWNYLDIFSSAVSFVEVAIAPHWLSRSRQVSRTVQPELRSTASLTQGEAKWGSHLLARQTRARCDIASTVCVFGSHGTWKHVPSG